MAICNAILKLNSDASTISDTWFFCIDVSSFWKRKSLKPRFLWLAWLKLRPHAKNDLCFRRSPKLSFPEWTRYLDEIATAKKLDVNEIKVKLVECGTPGTTGATVSGVSHLNLFYLFSGHVSNFYPDLWLSKYEEKWDHTWIFIHLRLFPEGGEVNSCWSPDRHFQVSNWLKRYFTKIEFPRYGGAHKQRFNSDGTGRGKVWYTFRETF